MKNVVLITRPEEDATAIAYALNQRGYTAFCEPFLEIHDVDADLPDLNKYNALVFTSANGVRAFCRISGRRDIPVYTVGDNTLAEARRFQFEHYKSAKGDADDLAALLSSEQKDQPVLYIRGQNVSKSLSELAPDVHFDEVVLYQSAEPEKISANCLDLFLDGAFSHILFFSVRTAESFVKLVGKEQESGRMEEALKRTKALCLGPSMIECLSVLPWQEIAVATSPDREAMLDLLEQHPV
jgi:uroporphyrinogen-III synthase